MMEQEVVDYILQAQKHGLSDFEIKQNLLNVGWEAGAVEESLVFAKASENKSMSSMQDQHKGLTPSPITPTLSANPQQFIEQQPVTASPAPVLSDISFQPNNANRRSVFKSPLLWIIVAVAILAGGGAFGYFNYVQQNPAKIWNKFLVSKKPTTFKNDYSFSYNDNSASSTGAVGVTFSGTSNIDFSDVNNLKSGGQFKADLKQGSINFNLNLGYLLLGKVLYVDISKVNEIKGFLGDNVSWVKVDFDELQKYLNGKQISTNLSTADQEKLKNQLTDIWSKANVIKLGTSSSKETLNGVAVYHLKPQFDTKNFNDAAISSLIAIQKSQSTSTEAVLTEQDKQTVTLLINKFQVKEFDIWVGQKDFLLYKVHLLTNAPTSKDLSNPALGASAGPLVGAQQKSRDARRLADMRQMASALELYYNDYNGYPDAKSGFTQGLTPTYILVFPVAPTPDGTCTNYYNDYWYTPEGTPSTKNGIKVYPSYNLTFCLGKDTGGYKAGIAKLTPQGIKDNIACPSKPEECVVTTKSNPQEISKAISQMSFGAEIKVDLSYSDYGKPQTFKAPENSTNILDLIKGALGSAQSKSDDASRLADILKLRSTLELYFNDKNTFPDTLQQLLPTYIALIPTSPTEGLGACSSTDNEYQYKKLSGGKNYQISFCLGSAVSGYSAGKHFLSGYGIK
jgi:hypothetical protein